MAAANRDVFQIAKQGMFSSGGTVTEPVEGDYDPATNWMDPEQSGNTAHVDHANVFYQIPASDNGNPIVYLHGYGQSRMGWMTTPDGREGWSDIFLKNGHAAFLVDQPRRGEAGAAAQMTADGFLDAWAEDSKEYKPGGTPEVGSEQYQKLLEAKVPIVIYFGDYIDNGPEDIASTGFWKAVRDGALQFMESYNGDGGACTGA